jgi:hypothetical protein
MATIKWGGTTSTDAELAANWQGGVKPDTTSDVIFDSTSSANCQLSANVSWKSVTSDTSWDMSIIFAGYDMTTSGAQTFDGNDVATHLNYSSAGTSHIITGDANFHVGATIKVTGEDDNCTIDLRGTGNLDIDETTYDPYELICAASGKTTTNTSNAATSWDKLTTGGGSFVNNKAIDFASDSTTFMNWHADTTFSGSGAIDFRYNGTSTALVPKFTCTSSATVQFLLGAALGTIKLSGNISVSNDLDFLSLQSTNGFFDTDGYSITVGGSFIIGTNNASKVNTTNFRTSVVDVAGDLSFLNDSGTSTITNMYFNSSTVYVCGSISVGADGTINITAGTALIECDGSTAATITSRAKTFPDIKINKSSNGVTLAGALTCGDFTHTDGNFSQATYALTCVDLNIVSSDTKTYNATVTSTGNQDIDVSVTISRLDKSSSTTHTQKAGTTFTLTNYTSGDWNSTTLQSDSASAFTFANPASMVVTGMSVYYSSASNVVDATSPTNTNLGGNTNWNFGAVAIKSRVHSVWFHNFG